MLPTLTGGPRWVSVAVAFRQGGQMSSKTDQKPDFEKALGELEELVAKLESGELSLDQSLAHFKRGVELTRLCQSILDEAQQTIELLTRADPAPTQDAVEPAD